MAKSGKKIGAAKIVLVFGQGDRRTGVVSSVVVRVAQPTRSGPRLGFTGPAIISEPTRQHVEETVLVIVDQILESLQLPRQNYDISIANLSAASVQDIGLGISGFSTDLPILLALLSAALQLPLPDDIVTTGHIASDAGDITAVQGIPAKIDAVVADGSVRFFISPDLDRDKSLATLSPNEYQRSRAAIMAAQDTMRTRQVNTVSEVVELVFAAEDIALAGFRLGFYDLFDRPPKSPTPTDKVARYFSQGNRSRFWVALEKFLLSGNDARAKELLESSARFHIERRRYDRLLGQKLLQLVLSLPPATRRLKLAFPLLAIGSCIKLSQFAEERDYEDVCVLFEAAQGRFTATELLFPQPAPETKSPPETDASVFAAVTAMISASALAQKLHIPIDSARGSFLVERSTVASFEELDQTVSAFYVHLQRHLNPHTIESLDRQKAKIKALALLERAFSKHGGRQQAVAQSVDGTRGGVKAVLDVVTERFKSEQQADYIQMVLTNAISPLNWKEKVNFIRTVQVRLNPFLPPEIASQPPERFAHDYEIIIQTLVQSFDQVNQLFRTI